MRFNENNLTKLELEMHYRELDIKLPYLQEEYGVIKIMSNEYWTWTEEFNKFIEVNKDIVNNPLYNEKDISETVDKLIDKWIKYKNFSISEDDICGLKIGFYRFMINTFNDLDLEEKHTDFKTLNKMKEKNGSQD